MTQLRTYQDTLDYIYSFIDPARKPAATPEAAALNLTRMDALLAAIGDPQAGMRAVVVAGTKGKGSTAAMLEAMLRASGRRVGLFTSPHLNSYRERIQVNRELISQGELIALAARLRPTIEAFDRGLYGRPTTFDIGLLLALRHFAEHMVDIAVLEVGLGGRFDAVNVVTPLVSAISSISYDHMSILGPTLADIAWNKAGIIKPGVPVVTVPQLPEASAMVAAEAAALGAPLWLADPASLLSASNGGSQPYPVAPRPALRGLFQVENARLALGIAVLLRKAGLDLPDAALTAGLDGVRWPGRFELVPASPRVLIDGAHNGDSAQKLAAAITAGVPHDRLVLILGTSRDKDIAGMAAALVPLAAAVVLTRSGHPRSMDLDRMVAEVGHHLRGPLVVTPDVRTALDAARGLAGRHDPIAITGSLFVAAAARAALGLAVSD
ncbi:MAG: bifunctional folylpolyglutamate synthase/dihydrofolate synthase [Chloroflexales bacterium]|nr:bifunctional folylpolyglutamate synthase/dihydrofolate synthase [Chloroflexales bacterium]